MQRSEQIRIKDRHSGIISSICRSKLTEQTTNTPKRQLALNYDPHSIPANILVWTSRLEKANKLNQIRVH